jgi:hypothetical protein
MRRTTKLPNNPSSIMYIVQYTLYRSGGHELLILNGGRFKPAFAEIDKKQTMKDLQRNLMKLL